MDFLNNLFWGSQIFGFLLNGALVIAAAYVIARAWDVRPIVNPKPVRGVRSASHQKKQVAITKVWEKIDEQSQRGEDGMRLAVIDADRLIDHLLKDAGYEGEGALARMRKLPAERLVSINGLIAAHRFRNKLVHEVGYTPNEQQYREHLSGFRNFLEEIGYLKS